MPVDNLKPKIMVYPYFNVHVINCQYIFGTQNFLSYPKSLKIELFLARIGKIPKHTYESENWRRCTLRGTLRHKSEGQPSVHLLSIYECRGDRL